MVEVVGFVSFSGNGFSVKDVVKVGGFESF